MADVRALLKAKRQEIKISHPLATYTSSGQLRCRACGTSVKHATFWEGHVGSKTHRINVARLKEEEKRRAQKEEAKSELHEIVGQTYSSVSTGKRKADDGQYDMQVELHGQENNTKRRKTRSAPQDGFPADFFSDSSRGPIRIRHSDDEDEEEPLPEDNLHPNTSTQSQVDLEYARFQQEMLGDVQKQSNHRETYERATVMAEPELTALEERPTGPQTSDSQMDVDIKERQSEQDSMRQRKELEERELIMDRLLDEERAQEEADQRVAMMKARLEALKQKRKSAKQPVT